MKQNKIIPINSIHGPFRAAEVRTGHKSGVTAIRVGIGGREMLTSLAADYADDPEFTPQCIFGIDGYPYLIFRHPDFDIDEAFEALPGVAVMRDGMVIVPPAADEAGCLSMLNDPDRPLPKLPPKLLILFQERLGLGRAA